MNIPSLPTDNLYKFMAIFGMTLWVSGVLLLWSFRTDLSDRTVHLRTLMTSSEHELENLTTEVDFFVKIATTSGEVDTSELSAVLNKQNNFTDRYSELDAIAPAYYSQIDFYYNVVSPGAKGLLALGSITTIIGFVLWYHRVQKYEDMILKGKAQEYIKTTKIKKSTKTKKSK